MFYTGIAALPFLFYQFCVYFPFLLAHSLDTFRSGNRTLPRASSSLPLLVSFSVKTFSSDSLSTVKRGTTQFCRTFFPHTCISGIGDNVSIVRLAQTITNATL